MNDKTRFECEKDQQKNYCYSFTFLFLDTRGMPRWATTMVGFENNRIGQKEISFARKSANADKDAALIAVSYLGFMSREEYFHE